MTKTEKEMKELEAEFPQWDKCMMHYLQATYSLYEDYADENYKKIHLDLIKIFEKILEFFISSSKVRDEFSEPRIVFYPFGLSVEVISKKMNTRFVFGLYHTEFYIDTFIDCPWYLKSMDDEFWHELTELNSLGKFCFNENVAPEDPHSVAIIKKVQSKKSQIFQMILNYALLESNEGSGDFGSIEVRWPSNTPWKNLLSKGTKAFKIMHKTNYKLYRAYYLSLRQKKPYRDRTPHH